MLFLHVFCYIHLLNVALHWFLTRRLSVPIAKCSSVVSTGILQTVHIVVICLIFVVLKGPIVESLRAYFTQFGKVDACTIMRDAAGRSRCFAFLTFDEPASVNAVMVREHFLDGKIVSV